MKKSGKSAAEIVDELLTMARGTAQVLEPVNLNTIVQDYLMSPEFYHLEKLHPDVTVQTELEESLPFIHASGIHLRKAVMNLVSNAVEALNNNGNIFIRTNVKSLNSQKIKGYEKVKDGNYIRLSVEDTGQGITDEDLERIFEPFYTKKVLGRSGTGLGLSIVWNTVHDHQGYINVLNRRHNTCFELYFPVPETEISPEKNKVVTFEDYTGNNETILIVDDIETQRQVARNMLERLGYRTEAVASGEEAVEFVKENNVDLVILDMIMDPGISGLETYKQLLQIDDGVKAVISSGYSKTDDVQKAQKMGAGDFIKKPYSLEKIGMAVKRELIGKRKQ